MEIQKTLRYRINVSQTSTGKKSWEATVDAEGFTQDLVLMLIDDLVAELESRYPAEIPTVKEK